MTPTTRPAEPGPHAPPLERTRYFARMVVTPDDLTRDQHYENGRRRYWNRRLHGWGAVSGLDVDKAPAALTKGFAADALLLSVTRGDVLDPQGREISLTRDALVDVAHVDGHGHCVIVMGDGADPTAAGARPAARPGGTLHFAVRHAERPARFVPSPAGNRPDGSEACEATVIRDSHAFGLLTVGAGDAAAAGWVVLATLENYAQPGMTVVLDDRHDFPIDPVDDADSADDLVRALADGHLERAESHLNRRKSDIARGLRRLLDDDGLHRLHEIGPRGRLDEVPAKHLAPGDEDRIGSARLREFFVRAESPFEPRRAISVQCLSRLSRQEFTERVRFIFRSDEISDVAIHHAHRAACLLTAVVPQWPAPTFRGLTP